MRIALRLHGDCDGITSSGLLGGGGRNAPVNPGPSSTKNRCFHAVLTCRSDARQIRSTVLRAHNLRQTSPRLASQPRIVGAGRWSVVGAPPSCACRRPRPRQRRPGPAVRRQRAQGECARGPAPWRVPRPTTTRFLARSSPTRAWLVGEFTSTWSCDEIRDPRSEIRDPKQESRGGCAWRRDPRAGVRDQRAGMRGRRSEGGVSCVCRRTGSGQSCCPSLVPCACSASHCRISSSVHCCSTSAPGGAWAGGGPAGGCARGASCCAICAQSATRQMDFEIISVWL
jgi:hypothetical protein